LWLIIFKEAMTKRRIFGVIIILLFLSTALPFAEGRIFDFRTHKNLSSPLGITFDNVPHLYESPRGNAYGYSGLFVGDTVKVSGVVVSETPLEIIFPSGKTVKIPVSNNYFEKEITFDEEGKYKVRFTPSGGVPIIEYNFSVCFKAIPILPTKLVKDILNGVSEANDETGLKFVNWNDACVREEGKGGTAFLLIVDNNGNPLTDLKGKYFTTDKYGIATILFSSSDVNIYGNIKAAKYDKLVFDRKGNLVYSTKPEKIEAILQDNTLYLNEKQFFSYVFPEARKVGKDITIITDFSLDFSDVGIADNYISESITNIAIPAKVIKKDNDTYVNAESLLVLIGYRHTSDAYFGILGTSIRYYPDRIEIYIVEGG